MKQKEIVVGIDVSKATLDICVLNGQYSDCHRISNQSKAIRSFFNKLQATHKQALIVVCMESTGYYNWPCYEVFNKMAIELFVVNPLHLKKSMGMIRGKSDAVDATRIARFISLHKPELKPTLIPRNEIRLMQALLAQRSRLVETRQKINIPANELVYIADKSLSQKIKQSSQTLVKEIEKQIKSLEKQLKELIENDPELKQQYRYITSVQGVGKVLAWAMLIKTNEFRSINDPRKLGCLAGVVPFEHSSGTSIYKKPKVSVMGDKKLKKLLHMSAMRAIQLKGDLQNYYIRKVNEGKSKMLVLNAVRNKIIARICSCVNNKKVYQINLLLS